MSAAVGVCISGAAAAQDSPQAPLVPPSGSGTAVAAGSCSKTDFETVVDQSAAALRDLNLQNRPRFQEKLRALRDKRGWSQDQFLKEAVPYVKDEQIDAFDRKTSELLTKITSMGDEGSASATPDCNIYQGLRANMSELVDTQNAKWAYMFKKIDAALGE
jgi:transcriptional regulator with XRE-family HTH domain